jgi:hypothetical protein
MSVASPIAVIVAVIVVPMTTVPMTAIPAMTTVPSAVAVIARGDVIRAGERPGRDPTHSGQNAGGHDTDPNEPANTFSTQ